MKKRILSFAMAAILTLAPAKSMLAEEMLVEDTAEALQTEDTAETVVADATASSATSDNITEELSTQENMEIMETDPVMSADITEELSATENMEIIETDETTEDTEAGIGQENTAPDDSVEISSGDDLILDIQEVESVEPVELEASESTVTVQTNLQEEESWELQGTVSSSGRAIDAVYPRARIYGESVYENSYGGQLFGNARRVYDAMVTAYVQNRSTETVYVTPEGTMQYDSSSAEEKAAVEMEVDYMVQAAFDAFKYDYPEIYWLGLVSYGAQVKRQIETEQTICTVTQIRVIPKEDYAGAALTSEQAAFTSAVAGAYQRISAVLTAGSTTQDKVLAIHDYICGKTTYDDNYATYTDDDPRNAYIHSAAGIFLKGGSAVCEGYAKAFKILCARFGIESVLVTGDALGGSHMWNYVKMDDGNWYLVDATWDDQDSGIIYTYFLVGSLSVNAYGNEISLERLIYLNFSPSNYTKTFAVPIWSAYAYDGENKNHAHSWTADDEGKVIPTCLTEGHVISTCKEDNCNQRTIEFFDQTEHSFRNTTVYNNDATCVADGTKTYYCDYGCGTVGKTVVAEGTRLPATYTVNADSLRLKKGQVTTALKISGLGPGDYVDSWKSTKKSVVRVSGKPGGTCKITAKKVGKATIIATLKSGTKIRISVRVQKKAVQTTGIQDVPSKLTIKKGKTRSITATVLPITCELKVTYTSSNPKVATVSKKGKIKAKKKGKTVITVQCGSKKKKCKVTVK